MSRKKYNESTSSAKKLLKQKYDKKLERLALNFNEEERAVLEKMRLKEDWENISGYIKYKIFGYDTETEYKKLLTTRKKEDIYIVMKSLMDALNKNLEYLRYKINTEIDRFNKQHSDYEQQLAIKAAEALELYNRKTGTNVKFKMEDLAYTIARLDRIDVKKQIGILNNWRESIEKKMDKMFHDCQVILRSIDIAVEKGEIDPMSLLTDEELEPYGNDFSNTNSPEAREFYRRANERAKKINAEKNKTNSSKN